MVSARVADPLSFDPDPDPDPTFRLNTDPDPIRIQGFDDQNIQLKKMFGSKPKFTYPQASIKYEQVTEEAFSSQKRTSSTSKHKNSLIFSTFVGNFCPPISGSATLIFALMETAKGVLSLAGLAGRDSSAVIYCQYQLMVCTQYGIRPQNSVITESSHGRQRPVLYMGGHASSLVSTRYRRHTENSVYKQYRQRLYSTGKQIIH